MLQHRCADLKRREEFGHGEVLEKMKRSILSFSCLTASYSCYLMTSQAGYDLRRRSVNFLRFQNFVGQSRRARQSTGAYLRRQYFEGEIKC